MIAEQTLPTYEAEHDRLLASGYYLRFHSSSGSKYYCKLFARDVRVSDHEPNQRTAQWIRNRNVIDIRVVSPFDQIPVVAEEEIVECTNYFSRPEISRSMIAKFVESPRLFEALYVTRKLIDDFSSDALAIGSVTHQQLLEPEADKVFKIIPERVLSKSGSRAGAEWKQFEADNEGFILLKRDDYDTVMRAVEAVRKCIGPMLDHEHAQREREIYWTDDETGLKLRAKLDLVVPTQLGLYVPDIKTCARLDKFQWAVKEDLWLQYAHYREAARMEFGEEPEFMFVVVEKSGTFRVRCFTLDEQTTARADELYRDTKRKLAACLESGDFTEEDEGSIVQLSLNI